MAGSTVSGRGETFDIYDVKFNYDKFLVFGTFELHYSLFESNSLPMKSHYEVLNLEKTCSAKDIKDSFIKLSKQYHPDKNKNSEAHKKFVEVNEAYSVLGKTCSRAKYDESLLNAIKPPQAYPRSYRQTAKNAYEFYGSPYSQYYRYSYEKSGNWSGSIKFKTVLCCFLVMAVGSGLQLMLVCSGIKKKEAKNREISLILKEVKERSHQLGTQQVLKEMEEACLQQKIKTNNERDD